MNSNQCECGASQVSSRRDYKFIESGLDNIILKNIEVLECPQCKTVSPRIPRHNSLLRTIALALIAKPYPLSGPEIKYLRKFLAMTQEEFAKYVSADTAVISRWENDVQPVGPQSDRLIRLIALGLGEGLKEKAASIIRMFENLHESRKKIRVTVQPETNEYDYEAA
ncbi:MAG: hypothetical protein DMG65_19785 [Candidatus Angelobacter sp. Gp1-AA117]|nr:MAG: hypothetical protein DMG65_19785 [Candidatus Angelobacter sp. Gp1-AA117]